MNCANVILFDVFHTFHVAKLLAVGATSLNVYVAILLATFHCPSVTYHVTVTLHFCHALTV